MMVKAHLFVMFSLVIVCVRTGIYSFVGASPEYSEVLDSKFAPDFIRQPGLVYSVCDPVSPLYPIGTKVVNIAQPLVSYRNADPVEVGNPENASQVSACFYAMPIPQSEELLAANVSERMISPSNPQGSSMVADQVRSLALAAEFWFSGKYTSLESISQSIGTLIFLKFLLIIFQHRRLMINRVFRQKYVRRKINTFVQHDFKKLRNKVITKITNKFAKIQDVSRQEVVSAKIKFPAGKIIGVHVDHNGIRRMFGSGGASGSSDCRMPSQTHRALACATEWVSWKVSRILSECIGGAYSAIRGLTLTLKCQHAITINLPSMRSSYRVVTNKHHSVAALKHFISVHLGMNEESFYLHDSGRNIRDDAPVNEYDNLYVRFRLRGGAPKKTTTKSTAPTAAPAAKAAAKAATAAAKAAAKKASADAKKDKKIDQLQKELDALKANSSQSPPKEKTEQNGTKAVGVPPKSSKSLSSEQYLYYRQEMQLWMDGNAHVNDEGKKILVLASFDPDVKKHMLQSLPEMWKKSTPFDAENMFATLDKFYRFSVYVENQKVIQEVLNTMQGSNSLFLTI